MARYELVGIKSLSSGEEIFLITFPRIWQEHTLLIFLPIFYSRGEISIIQAILLLVFRYEEWVSFIGSNYLC